MSLCTTGVLSLTSYVSMLCREFVAYTILHTHNPPPGCSTSGLSSCPPGSLHFDLFPHNPGCSSCLIVATEVLKALVTHVTSGAAVPQWWWLQWSSHRYSQHGDAGAAQTCCICICPGEPRRLPRRWPLQQLEERLGQVDAVSTDTCTEKCTRRQT